MSVKIGHASIDERGRVNSGTAGDQTGKELCIRDWYNKGWSVLLRPKSATVAEKMAKACEAGCKNAKIGYDQYQRNTLRTQAKAAGWDLSKIAKACETDCSAFMTVCAEAAGVDMSGCYTSGNAPTTYNMRAKFKATGAFEVLTDSKYLTSPDYLRRGDVLVYEKGHTVMVLSNGAKAGTSSGSNSSGNAKSQKVAVAKYIDKSLAGTYKTTAELNMRTDAGTGNAIICTIPKGKAVQCYGYYNEAGGAKWLYVVYSGKTGYCHSNYLRK